MLQSTTITGNNRNLFNLCLRFHFNVAGNKVLIATGDTIREEAIKLLDNCQITKELYVLSKTKKSSYEVVMTRVKETRLSLTWLT